jgi:hypothetical protein
MVDLDGEWDEPAWNRDAKRAVFADDTGTQARPYSEIRLLADPSFVYVGLYAADEDIRSTDQFALAIGSLAVTIDPTGTTSDTRVRAAADRDGTLDRSDDDDEEWVIEAAIPRVSLPQPPWRIDVSRCDVTHAGARRCGAWHGTYP